jgi:hypothetical protein
MWKSVTFAFALSALPLVTSAYAYPTPLTKEECAQMTGTTWDQAQDKCVWNELVKEGCIKLAGKTWDESQQKCMDQEKK